MPEVRAFRGVRFADVAPMKDLVCPPYDVISPAEQERLHELDPHNAVRIELPFSDPADETDRYTKAAEQFSAWLADGTLVRDEEERLYVYRQDYEIGRAHV